LTKKKDAPFNPSSAQNNKENNRPQRNKTVISIPLIQPIVKEKKEGTVKQWLAERLKDKLQKSSILSIQTHKPIILYRISIEENENAVEEEVCYLTGIHIVQLIYAYGGFVPSTFQKIEVFTLEKFTKWILQERKKDLLLQCIDGLDQN
jgi:hypothetical protein